MEEACAKFKGAVRRAGQNVETHVECDYPTKAQHTTTPMKLYFIGFGAERRAAPGRPDLGDPRRTQQRRPQRTAAC